MSARRYRPRRPLRREFLLLALAGVLPLALALVLPYEALSFRPTDGAETSCFCAFVRLTPDEERRALARARSAWQIGAEGTRGLRLDMFAMPLADERSVEVLDFSGRLPPPPPADARLSAFPLPPSLAAPAPQSIAAEPVRPAAPVFSRAELLRLGDEPFGAR